MDHLFITWYIQIVNWNKKYPEIQIHEKTEKEWFQQMQN